MMRTDFSTNVMQKICVVKLAWERMKERAEGASQDAEE